MDPVLADCSLRQIVWRVWLSFIHKIPYFTSGNSFVRQILYLFYHTLDWRLESLVTPLQPMGWLAASRGLTQFAVRFKIKNKMIIIATYCAKASLSSVYCIVMRTLILLLDWSIHCSSSDYYHITHIMHRYYVQFIIISLCPGKMCQLLTASWVRFGSALGFCFLCAA